MKKVLSFIFAVSMSVSAMSLAVDCAVAEDSQSAVSATEEIQSGKYTVFYKDIDKTAIENEAEEKRSEYIYTLYEQNVTGYDIEYLSTEYYSSIRLELLENAYSERAGQILDMLGVDKDKAFCSAYTPTIVCTLTDEQVKIAEESELIESISVYTAIDPEPSTEGKSEEKFLDTLISADENFSDGGLICNDKYKVDLQKYSPDSDTVATLIVYGFENARDMKYNPPVENHTDFTWRYNPTEFHSGFTYYVSAKTDTACVEKGKTVKVMYFADNSVRDSSQTELGLIKGSEYYGFDVAPYIYPEIIAGDTDGDGAITASDASAVLSAYSMISTGNDIPLNSTIFDYNSDGAVNADDASAILSRYSELATT